MTDDRFRKRSYSWASTLKHLRNKRSLRPLEKVVKDFERRISELEKAQVEMNRPRKLGRPLGSKNKAKIKEEQNG